MMPRRLAPAVPVVVLVVVVAAVAALATRSAEGSTTRVGAAPSAATPSAGPSTDAASPAGPSALAARVSAARQNERKAALTSALASLAATTTADFGVAIADHTTGSFYSFGGDEEFETASVVKVEILAALVMQARAAGRALTATQRGLAAVMIRQSDNAAASTLWWQIGDVDGLAAASDTLGLTDTDPGDGGWWSLTTTTAVDQVTMLDSIADPAGPLGSANATILALMGKVVADQTWGVSAAANAGETTILKNGWMPRSDQDGRWTVNSIGRITGDDTDLTIAVLSRGHTGLDSGIALVEKVARLSRTLLAR